MPKNKILWFFFAFLLLISQSFQVLKQLEDLENQWIKNKINAYWLINLIYYFVHCPMSHVIVAFNQTISIS